MTGKPIAPPVAAPAGRFPEFPPRDDMQNALHLDDQGHQPALRRYLGAPLTTVVISEVPIGWNIHTRRENLRVPDLLIAFNVSRDLVVSEMGYSIDEHGKPPDFVLEIASPTTARNDEINKPADYARFGVPEYWRFDPEGGKYYETHLAGDRLVNGTYQSIPIHKVDDDRYWGHSEALNLDICWEYGEIRWYDPVAQRYLLTYDEADDERRAAEARIRELEAEVIRLQNQ